MRTEMAGPGMTGAVTAGSLPPDTVVRAWQPPLQPSADGDVRPLWEGRTRIFLRPLAPPSVIGLFGFMGATLMVGAWQAGWYGTAATPAIIFPFALMFGGLMQGASAFPSLWARDALAAAVHATWGAFWLAYGLLWGLIVGGVLPATPLGAANPSMAMWFVVLGAITTMMAVAATATNWNIAAVLWTLAAGSGLTAAGMWGGMLDITHAGGVLFVISAGIAWYAATAMVLENMIGRIILPIFKPDKAAVIPGRRPSIPMQYEQGMPGVKVGQ
jgi:succinate-acetate transporter protein